MLMSLRTALCFSESSSSSPRKTGADSSPATTEYLKMARKGGGRKGMVRSKQHTNGRTEPCKL